jgi:hypothetical protein
VRFVLSRHGSEHCWLMLSLLCARKVFGGRAAPKPSGSRRSVVLVAALSAPMFPRGVHRRERTARPVVDAGALVFRRGRVARPMRRLRQCRHGSPSAPVRWLRCLTVACCRKPTLESGRPRPSFLSDGGIESVGRPFPGVDHVGRRGGRRLDASTRGIRRSLRYRMRRRVVWGGPRDG